MTENRNDPAFKRVLRALTYSSPIRDIAHRLLEKHFQDDYLLVVGNVQTIEAAAKELRLGMTTEECVLVLDYIARKSMVIITLEHVETAAYALFGNRFIEP